MSAKKSTEVANTQEAGLPAELMATMGQDVGRGVSQDPNDVGVPFIAVLQDMSPQVKPRDPDYVDGAVAGNLFNTVSKEIYPHGIEFLPVSFESVQVEWVPRDSGGGFVAKHPANTPLLAQAQPNPTGRGAPRLPSGNDLVDTRYWYGFYRPLGADGQPTARWEPAVISFSSTGLGVSRDWMGMVKRNYIPNSDQVAPIWSRIYTITTKLKSKNNNEWFLPEPVQGRWVTADEYAQGKAYADLAESGRVKVSQPDAQSQADETVL